MAEIGYYLEFERAYLAVIPRVFAVDEHAFAGRRGVAVNARTLVSAAMVHESDAGGRQYLGYVQVMSERVRHEVDIEGILGYVEQLRQIFARLQNLPRQRLAVGHILVRLYPFSRRDLPSALFDTLFYLGQHFGAEAVDHLIRRRLRLTERHIGKVAHQIQYRAERFDRHGGGLVVAPHPVHIYMRVGNKQLRVLFRLRLKRHKRRLGFLRGFFRYHAVFFNAFQKRVGGVFYQAVKFAAVVFRNSVKVRYLGDYPLRVCAVLSVTVKSFKFLKVGHKIILSL